MTAPDAPITNRRLLNESEMAEAIGIPSKNHNAIRSYTFIEVMVLLAAQHAKTNAANQETIREWKELLQLSYGVMSGQLGEPVKQGVLKRIEAALKRAEGAG